MGRLFKWIRSTSTARAATRREASSRRQLRFESCEQRIALSTNTVELVEHDNSDGELNFLNEGGLISLSISGSTLADNDSLIGSFDSENFTNPRTTFTVDATASFVVRAEAIKHFIKSGGEFSYRFTDFAISGELASLGEPALTNNKGFDYPSLSAGDEYDLTLQSPELTPPSVNSDLSVIPAPTPAEQPGVGGNEGGQIALTPFVAPTGLTLANGQGTASLARSKPNLEELRNGAEGRGEATRVEGLRGRAVVYEVAAADDKTLRLDEQAADDAKLAERDAIELASLDQLSPTSFNGRIERAVPVTSESLPAPMVDEESVDESASMSEAAVDFLESIEWISLNGDDVAALPSLNGADEVASADRDAAFADWNGGQSLAAADAYEPANGSRDRRMLGVGAAVALSFMPIRKAWRRRGEPNAPEQAPRLR